VAVVLRFHLMVCYHVHHLGLQGDTLADHRIAIILNDYIAGVSLASAAFTSTGYAFTASTSGNTVVNRLRFINTNAFSQYFVKIDGHSIRVIELDGILVCPMVTGGVYHSSRSARECASRQPHKRQLG